MPENLAVNNRASEAEELGMDRVGRDESTPDTRDVVRQRLRALLADGQSDSSVVDQFLADRQSDLVLEGTLPATAK
jgi:hypothetical protein